MMDDLFATSLSTYGPEEREALRDIQDEIKQYTQSDGATEKHVLTLQDEASALRAESALLYSLLNPSLPPRPPLPSIAVVTPCMEDGSTLTFSSAKTWLGQFLTVAKDARSRVWEAAQAVVAMKKRVEYVELKRKQAQKAWELSALMKEEADVACREQDNLQRDVDALQDQCMDVDKSIQNPPPFPRLKLCPPQAPVTAIEHRVGMPAAAYAEQEFSQAMHACEEQRDRAKKANDKLLELTANKKDNEDRLRTLKLRLEQLKGRKRGADGNVDCATPSKTAKAEAADSAL